MFGCVEKILSAWDPDYVVLQLGVDGLPGDHVGQYGAWGVSGEGSTTWVVAKVKEWGRPTCVLGGGGYNHANAARAWALATAELVERDIYPDTEVPDQQHFEEYAPSFTLEVSESAYSLFRLVIDMVRQCTRRNHRSRHPGCRDVVHQPGSAYPRDCG
jgi:histone deacetylase 1/2/histone deacetylase 8